MNEIEHFNRARTELGFQDGRYLDVVEHYRKKDWVGAKAALKSWWLRAPEPVLSAHPVVLMRAACAEISNLFDGLSESRHLKIVDAESFVVRVLSSLVTARVLIILRKDPNVVWPVGVDRERLARAVGLVIAGCLTREVFLEFVAMMPLLYVDGELVKTTALIPFPGMKFTKPLGKGRICKLYGYDPRSKAFKKLDGLIRCDESSRKAKYQFWADPKHARFSSAEVQKEVFGVTDSRNS